MVLKGKAVKNKKYGVGIITDQDTEYVYVKFTTEREIKQFPYPKCFKIHLQLADPSIAAQMEVIVSQFENQEADKKKEAQKIAAAKDLGGKVKNAGINDGNIVVVPQFTSVSEFCDTFKLAVNREVKHVKSNGGKRHKLFDGERVDIRQNRYIYTFEAEEELKFPEGTKVSIWTGKPKAPGELDEGEKGSIIGCEDFTVILATTANLGETVSEIEFSAEPWRLLDTLNNRLDEMKIHPSPIVKALICDGKKSIDHHNPCITTGQNRAVNMAKTQPITFIWGPPGTGKTQTLAKIAIEHVKMGHRVLMLSYSNVSVDGAIMRVSSMDPNAAPGVYVRYGYARDKNLLDHPYLSSYNLTLHLFPGLEKERKDLLREKKNTSKKSKRFVEITQRLNTIRKTMDFEEKNSVAHAKFVATTVSKAVVDKVLYEGEFDVVIFDEASMAYIPQIVFAAGLARKHFICMGDFRQLPPIVQESNESVLNADIFQYCGITSAVDNGKNHKWLCMLDVQYRMHPRISDFTSHVMYNGLLKSADSMAEKRKSVVETAPAYGHPLAFADLSGMMSVCTKTGDNSRINVLSALMSFALALRAAEKHEVGIITPYHAQSRLLHAMARDAEDNCPDLQSISCATVHQFQGSEKDVIVYDAVDCYRMPFPGMLLTCKDNNYANRLFNVAVTRARGKFIGVANVAYMDNKNLSKNLMFERLITIQKKNPSCITGAILSGARELGGKLMEFFDKDKGNEAFLTDLMTAKKEIRIDIPEKPVDSAFLKQLKEEVLAAKSRGVTVYIRAERKQSIPAVLRPYVIEKAFLVANPVTVIDKKIVWFGMPPSESKFVTEGITLETRHRPVIRFAGAHTAKVLFGFLGMGKVNDENPMGVNSEGGHQVTETLSSYVFANVKCPKCKKPMQLRKSKNGKFFLGCSAFPACSHTDFVDEYLVNKYLARNKKEVQKCPGCKYSLEARNGPFGLYVQCCGPTPHKWKLDQI